MHAQPGITYVIADNAIAVLFPGRRAARIFVYSTNKFHIRDMKPKTDDARGRTILYRRIYMRRARPRPCVYIVTYSDRAAKRARTN